MRLGALPCLPGDFLSRAARAAASLRSGWRFRAVNDFPIAATGRKLIRYCVEIDTMAVNSAPGPAGTTMMRPGATPATISSYRLRPGRRPWL